MGVLEGIAEVLEEDIALKDELREAALKSTRAIIRSCSRAISKMVAGQDYREDLNRAREESWRLRGTLEGHPDLMEAGYVRDALRELVEASVLEALLAGKRPPNHRTMKVSPVVYLEGLADAAGELRRLALERILSGDLEGAQSLIPLMEEIYATVRDLSIYGISHGLRPRADRLRDMIGRTKELLAMKK
ncbi:MAG: hypothetical protein J7J79_02350 [Thermoplasmata archaeon]|nr:hypothetical protein [Thermoplasmata archaeon]